MNGLNDLIPLLNGGGNGVSIVLILMLFRSLNRINERLAKLEGYLDAENSNRIASAFSRSVQRIPNPK